MKLFSWKIEGLILCCHHSIANHPVKPLQSHGHWGSSASMGPNFEYPEYEIVEGQAAKPSMSLNSLKGARCDIEIVGIMASRHIMDQHGVSLRTHEML